MNNFAERMLTIIVGCSISIFLVQYSKETTIFLFSVFGIACIVEYNHLVQKTLSNKIIATILGLLPYIYHIIWQYGEITSDYLKLGLVITAIGIGMCQDHLHFVAKTFIGIVWTCPSMIICMLYGIEDPMKVIVIMTISWCSDGGAFICGKIFGRNKLASNISPNKTIEGLIGGLIFSMTIAYIFSYYYFGISRLDLCVLALICGVSGSCGDLVESKFKRILNIKDSGTVVFGMGGCLDRLDSIFFAIPVSFLYLKLF